MINQNVREGHIAGRTSEGKKERKRKKNRNRIYEIGEREREIRRRWVTSFFRFYHVHLVKPVVL